MIAFIEGVICEKYTDHMIILHQGIGLRLNFDPAYAGQMPAVGETAKIYTYLHVREDELSLYAFSAYEEKQLFELLLTVSGIGPKVAGTIVASISPDEFALAILEADDKRFTKIKGVGKKTAERLIFELKDKLAKATNITQKEHLEKVVASIGTKTHTLRDEAIAALCVLGYTETEATKAIDKVLVSFGDKLTLNELIKQSLKTMAML